MAAAVPSAGYPTTPEFVLPRGVRLIRVVCLLLGGFAITFSATLHEQLRFDLGISAGVLACVGVAHLVEWLRGRAYGANPVSLALAAASVVAAILLPLQSSAIGFAVVVAAWALVSALLEFVGNTVRPGSRQDATLLGAAGVLLAILSLIFRGDPVAVVGLLGAYAVIAGVFLGISAFDSKSAKAATTPIEPTELSGAQRADHSNS